MKPCLDKLGLVALLAFPLLACAAHNSHRVPIDLNADLAPLIDEAWARMEEAWGGAVPVGGTPVEVAVEPVQVQWLPFSPEVPPGASTIAQPDLRKTIEDVLKPPAPLASGVQSDPYRVHVELAADLHEPDALEIQVECALVDDAAGVVLARGWSTIVHFERLYCHGCRERWSGHGTALGGHVGGAEGAAFVGTSFFYFPTVNCSPGYIKN